MKTTRALKQTRNRCNRRIGVSETRLDLGAATFGNGFIDCIILIIDDRLVRLLESSLFVADASVGGCGTTTSREQSQYRTFE